MSKLRSFIRDAVRNTVRKVLGKPELPKPRIIKAPLFGSRRALLRLFGLGIKWRAQLHRARFKPRRNGLSAKNPHARMLSAKPNPAGTKLGKKAAKHRGMAHMWSM